MRVGVPLMILLATPQVASAQYHPGSDGGRYAATVVNQAGYLETERPVQLGYRGTWPGRNIDRLLLRGRLSSGQQTRTTVYQSRRQAGYYYLPQYPQLWEPGANVPPRQALAPRPIYRPPLADPFYEERVLSGVLGDSSGYYAPW